MKNNGCEWMRMAAIGALAAAFAVSVALAAPEGGALPEKDLDTFYREALAAGGDALAALPGELEMRAKAGEVNAWTLLGLYFGHDAEKKDAKKAFRYYRKGAEAGDPWGAYFLAEGFRDGDGTRKNNRQAFRWMQTAWEGGLPEAAFEMSSWICKDSGEKAQRLYELDVKDVDAAAAWALDGLQRLFEEAGEGYLADLAVRSRGKDGESLRELAFRMRFERDGDSIGELPIFRRTQWRRELALALVVHWLWHYGPTEPETLAMLVATAKADDGEFNPEDLMPPGTPLPETGATVGDMLVFMGGYGGLALEDLAAFGLATPKMLAAKERMAERGDTETALELANYRESGGRAAEDGLQEARWRLAATDDPHSQYRLGCLYALGEFGGEIPASESSWWFARCLEADGEDAPSANNALLFLWLSGKPVWRKPTADDPEQLFRRIQPGDEGWEELGEELASRAEETVEEGAAFFAPLLLAIKALREGDADAARQWVETMPEEISALILESWDAVVAGEGGETEMTQFEVGLCKMFGVEKSPDWLAAMASLLPSATDGKTEAARLVYLLANCNWWGGRRPEIAREIEQGFAMEGDSWLAEKAAAHVWVERFCAGAWEGSRDAVMQWLELADDTEDAARLRKACDVMEETAPRIRAILDGPIDAENLHAWGEVCDEFKRRLRELSSGTGEGDEPEDGQQEAEPETERSSSSDTEDSASGVPERENADG